MSHQKISALEGNFQGGTTAGDFFGHSVAALGDLDGDGVVDLAVGASRDGQSRGAVWVLFLNTDGTVKDHQKINDLEGNFQGTIDDGDAFGISVAALGDVDSDGVVDLAVGAWRDFDSGYNAGAVWVLFLNPDGTVKDHQKISELEGNFQGTIDDGDGFGSSVAALGDLDGDGVVDLAVGALFDDDGGSEQGAVWVLFLNSDGTVKDHETISATQGGFTGNLDDVDFFGYSLASLGDLDGDGVVDLAVGAPGNDNHTYRVYSSGAVWVLFLNPDGTVKGHQKISELEGNFQGTLGLNDYFGSSVAVPGDLDGDGVVDLAVGAFGDEDGGDFGYGAVWVLFLNANGTVKSHQKISATEGGFTGSLEAYDLFGSSVTSLGDLDGDGIGDLAVGAFKDDDRCFGEWCEFNNTGAVWVLFLDGIITIDFETEDDFATPLVNGQSVSSTEGFGGLLDIDGFPASGLTAAVFDSTPSGPNAFSSDPDLLVDLGEVLILQEVPGQSLPGIYDFPDDDRLGGDFLITFKGLEVELTSIDLVDICPIPSQNASVTLTDSGGNTRVYTVPSGWTEDVAVHGPPGFRTLDLTTMADQPGFVATATVAEDGGFNPAVVVMLDIHLGGSAAVDNLIYDPHPNR